MEQILIIYGILIALLLAWAIYSFVHKGKSPGPAGPAGPPGPSSSQTVSGQTSLVAKTPLPLFNLDTTKRAEFRGLIFVEWMSPKVMNGSKLYFFDWVPNVNTATIVPLFTSIPAAKAETMDISLQLVGKAGNDLQVIATSPLAVNPLKWTAIYY